MLGELADFLKAAGVHEFCNPFPRRQLAARVLFLNALCSAAEL